MSLLQKSSLFFLVTFMVMVVAVPHGKFNASRTTMGSETSTSTSHPWSTASDVTSSGDDATERITLNSSFSSSSKPHTSSTIFKPSNISSLASKPAMSGDNVDKKAEAREEGGNVKITGGGFVEVSITELSIGVCLGNCYDDLQVCYEAVNPSSQLPQTICGVPGQCGLRFGTIRANPSKVWFMLETTTALRTDVAECKFAKIQSGDVEYVYPRDRLDVVNAGCTPRIVPGGYTKIIVKGASENCPVLIKDAKLKPEPTTVAPTPVADGTQEASNAELYIGLAVGGLILFIIIVVVIIGVLCWKKRQYKTKQQLPPAKPMKTIMGKPIEDSKPRESATAIPVEAKPVAKKQKVSVPADTDTDIEKAEPDPMKPQVAKKPKDKAAQLLEEIRRSKEAKKTLKERSLVVDETQKDGSKPRKTASKKKKTAKLAAAPPRLPSADSASSKKDASRSYDH